MNRNTLLSRIDALTSSNLENEAFRDICRALLLTPTEDDEDIAGDEANARIQQLISQLSHAQVNLGAIAAQRDAIAIKLHNCGKKLTASQTCADPLPLPFKPPRAANNITAQWRERSKLPTKAGWYQVRNENGVIDLYWTGMDFLYFVGRLQEGQEWRGPLREEKASSTKNGRP